MCSDVVPVHENVCDALHAVEFYEEAFCGPFRRDIHAVLIVPCGFEPVPLGEGVGIPAVRERDMACVVGGSFGLEEESPAFVDREDLPGSGVWCHRSEEQQNHDVSFHGGTFMGASGRGSPDFGMISGFFMQR